jgi:hypothetical protein
MTISLSRRALAPDLCHRRECARQNTITSNAKPVRIIESQGWGLAFDLPIVVSSFHSPDERSDIRERLRGFTAAPRVSLRSPGLRRNRRKRNAGKRRVTTAASCDAARALLERARLTAFHHGSHLRELFHPKGSASGQASWDAVCTGVTRLRLSQSREAPPTPVVMPGDMMPKPPGSRLQTHPRAPPSLP